MNPEAVAFLQIGNLRNWQFFACAAYPHFNLRTGQVKGCGVSINKSRDKNEQHEQSQRKRTQNHIPILEANLQCGGTAPAVFSQNLLLRAYFNIS